MYSLKCSYYKKSFATLEELLEDIAATGMDPNYFVTRDGRSIGERAFDLMEV